MIATRGGCMVLEHYLFLPFSSGLTTSSDEAVHLLRPIVQPRHNQRLGKSIKLEGMHNLDRIKS